MTGGVVGVMEEFKEREAAVLREAAGRGPDCLAAEQLGALAGEAAGEVADAHVHRCLYCQTQIGWMRQAMDAQPTEAEIADVKWVVQGLRVPAAVAEVRANWLSRVWAKVWDNPMMATSFAGAAACLLLAVGVAMRPVELTPVDGDGASGVVRSAQLELISPEGDVPVAPVEMVWSAVDGAARYELEVSEVDAAVIWRGASPAARMDIPGAVAARLMPGKTLQWKVRAVGGDGKAMAESSVIPFRVAIPVQEK